MFKSNRSKEQEDFSTLPEILMTVLPSNFLSYPENCKIYYRPYTYGEIQKFSQSEYATEDLYEEILRGVKTSFPKENLTLSDVLYIALVRRIASFGTEKYESYKRCPHCGETQRVLIDTDLMAFDDIKAKSLPVKFTSKKGQEVKFSPLTIGNYRKLTEENAKSSNHVMAISSSLGLDEGLRFIDLLSVRERNSLEKIDEILYHGTSPFKTSCNKCSKEIRVEIDSSQVFLQPVYASGEDMEGTISFGD